MTYPLECFMLLWLTCMTFKFQVSRERGSTSDDSLIAVNSGSHMCIDDHGHLAYNLIAELAKLQQRSNKVLKAITAPESLSCYAMCNQGEIGLALCKSASLSFSMPRMLL